MKTYDILQEVQGKFVLVQGSSISHQMKDVIKDLISNITSDAKVQVFEFKIISFRDCQWFHHLATYVNQALMQPIILLLSFQDARLLKMLDESASTDAMLFYRSLHILKSTVSSTKQLHAFVLAPMGNLCLHSLADSKVRFEQDECMVTNERV